MCQDSGQTRLDGRLSQIYDVVIGGVLNYKDSISRAASDSISPVASSAGGFWRHASVDGRAIEDWIAGTLTARPLSAADGLMQTRTGNSEAN
jgi:hypothetical protein